MTVITTSNKITYTGNGATTVFSFAFPGVAATDLQVYYTDATGVLTLLSPTLYTVALNPVSGTNPTAVGGTVTYPLVGSPIAVGTFLTIIRELDVTQGTSLANQGTLWQPVIEAALDYLTMIDQQFGELLGRQITVAVSDPNPLPLPPVAQRALKYLAFDSLGNPIAASAQSGTAIVSAAMAPVVAAATLALGRTAFGLGNVAVESIGAGLRDNGAGVLQVNFPPTSDSTNQAVAAAFHDTHRISTGPVVYTLARANTLWPGFGFWVNNLSGTLTFTPDANDSIQGLPSGTNFTVSGGARLWVYTDGAASGNWYIDNVPATAQPPAAGMINGQIVETHAAGAATFTLKTTLGNTPTAADPVIFIFGDANAALGDLVVRQVTGALSITVPSTALVGASNGVAFKPWIVAFDNAGTVVLGIINCRNGTSIYPLAGFAIASGIAIDAAADNSSVFYTNGTITSKAYIPIAYAAYESGLAVAGTWDASPTRIRAYGAGVPLPGTTIQQQPTFTGAVNTTTTAIPFDDTIPQITEGGEFLTQAVTASSLTNLFKIEWLVQLSHTGTVQAAACLFNTDKDAANALAVVWQNIAGAANPISLSGLWMMLPPTAAATTYRIRAGADTGPTLTFNGTAGARKYGGAAASYIIVSEIMT